MLQLKWLYIWVPVWTIYIAVPIGLLCIKHKSLPTVVCFDLWTDISCSKLWLSQLYCSCKKCKCSPLSQFIVKYVWLVWMWAIEGHKMRVSKSLLPHIHNVSLISLSLYQEAKLRWRWKISFHLLSGDINADESDQATLRCGGHTNCDRVTKTGLNQYMYIVQGNTRF